LYARNIKNNLSILASLLRVIVVIKMDDSDAEESAYL
jgi:hypothetical protein